MATETQTAEFGRVSRIRGVLFEALSFGASVVGLVALATLLVYVAIDAFDLANASPEWLLTYFLTLVVPYLAFTVYGSRDRSLARRTAIALGGGLVATAIGFTAVEALVRPIPRLTWQLTYLFVVVAPLTAYVTVVASQSPVGRVGFGFLGRAVGGTALGLALLVLFVVVDPALWFRAYTLGVVPAVLLAGYGHSNPDSRAGSLAVPVGVGGVVLAVAVGDAVLAAPTRLLAYAWSITVPVAAAAAWIVSGQFDRSAGTTVGGLSLAVPVVGGIAAGGFGLPGASVLLVLTAATAPTVVFLSRTVVADSDEGLLGLALPLVLGGGVLLGTVLVQTLGFPAPDPWLDLAYVTGAPSRTPADAGLYPAIVGSVVVIALVVIISFVFGVGSAVFLEEYTSDSGLVGALTRLIQVNIANLAAVPSVVYGLLGLGLFANVLGLGFGTAVTVSLTLSLLILPITIISAQEAIRAVPDDLRQGSYAMGATRWQTTKNVVLPEALPGTLTGTIIALGRAIGETAPLIMVGAATTVFSPPESVWSKISAMPMQIYAWSGFPQAEFRYGVVAAGVVTLLIVLLGMNATAIVLRNRYERGV